MITVQVDMDGVLANFESGFSMPRFDKAEFERQIMETSGFEYLDWEPNAEKLVLELKALEDRGVNIEILSSLGSTKGEVAEEAARQKKNWLLDRDIRFKRNFVTHKGLKKWFATPNSILIDDTSQNFWDWEEHKGVGILYKSDEYEKHLEELMLNVAHLMMAGDIYVG